MQSSRHVVPEVPSSSASDSKKAGFLVASTSRRAGPALSPDPQLHPVLGTAESSGRLCAGVDGFDQRQREPPRGCQVASGAPHPASEPLSLPSSPIAHPPRVPGSVLPSLRYR